MTAAFGRAYALELRKFVETEILLLYGLTRDEFAEKGRDWLGDRFNYLFDQISDDSLELEVMVAGLDAEDNLLIYLQK